MHELPSLHEMYPGWQSRIFFARWSDAKREDVEDDCTDDWVITLAEYESVDDLLGKVLLDLVTTPHEPLELLVVESGDELPPPPPPPPLE